MDGDLFLGAGGADALLPEGPSSTDVCAAGLDAVAVYDLLRLAERPQSVPCDEYIRANVNVYRVAGLRPFQPPRADTSPSLERNTARWIREADARWLRTDPQKVRDLKEGLQSVSAVVRYYGRNRFAETLRAYLFKNLDVLLAEKALGGTVDVYALHDVLKAAVQLCLWDGEDEAGRHRVLDHVSAYCASHHCAVASCADTFLRGLAHKDAFSLLDTERCRTALLAEYRALREVEASVLGVWRNRSDDELRDEMCALLAAHGRQLVPVVPFYKESFYIPQTRTVDMSLRISHELFYYLKGTATHQYQFTEEQWNEFVRAEGIRKENDVAAAFILGSRKAVTPAGVAQLLCTAPAMAAERIMAGDLETYLDHIGRTDAARKVRRLRQEYSSLSVDTFVRAVADGIYSERTNITDSAATPPPEECGLRGILRQGVTARELVSYILAHRYDEALVRALVQEGEVLAEVQEYAATTLHIPYIKLLLNVLHEYASQPEWRGQGARLCAALVSFVQERLDSPCGRTAYMLACAPVVDALASLLPGDCLERHRQLQEGEARGFPQPGALREAADVRARRLAGWGPLRRFFA